MTRPPYRLQLTISPGATVLLEVTSPVDPIDMVAIEEFLAFAHVTITRYAAKSPRPTPEEPPLRVPTPAATAAAREQLAQARDDDRAKREAEGIRCAGCRDVIKVGAYSARGSGPFCKRCLETVEQAEADFGSRCIECNVALANAGFRFQGAGPLCEPCLKKTENQAVDANLARQRPRRP